MTTNIVHEMNNVRNNEAWMYDGVRKDQLPYSWSLLTAERATHNQVGKMSEGKTTTSAVLLRETSTQFTKYSQLRHYGSFTWLFYTK